jgi:hypothetical protein
MQEIVEADSYDVITSRQIAADPNVPGFLLTLKWPWYHPTSRLRPLAGP